jgi:sugar phosphate isomerase/epimerase
MTSGDWVRQAASLPLDGVELYWPALRDADDDALGELRRTGDDLGLALPMMCASPDFIQPDRDRFEGEIMDEARAIRATATLGGTYTRILSGQRRPGVERSSGIALVVEAIERLLPVAANCGVTLVMENHIRDYFWDYSEFAQDSATFLEIVRAIPEDAPFGVQFDPSNALVSGEDPVWLLEQVAHRVVTAAASDRFVATGADGRTHVVHAIAGRGLLDHDLLCSILANAGFRGWISIEDGDDPVTGLADIAASAEYMRDVMGRHGLA